MSNLFLFGFYSCAFRDFGPWPKRKHMCVAVTFPCFVAISIVTLDGKIFIDCVRFD